MTEQQDPGQRVERALAGAWQGSALSEVLHVIVEGVARVAGFGVATLSLRTDSQGFEVVAVAGDQPGIRDLIGVYLPRSRLERELSAAEDWGLLRFVPHERMNHEVPTWVPDIEPIDAPDAWHPLDLLLAPLLDDDGEWRGILAVDLPESGRRPTVEQQRVLSTYAEQASRALVRALAQEELANAVRIAEAARGIVRRASARLSVDQILHECERVVLEAFRSRGMWIEVPGEDDGSSARSTIISVEHGEVLIPQSLVEVTARVAARCWHEQRVVILSPRRDRSDLVTPEEEREIMAFLAGLGRASMVLAPLGAGSRCLGSMVLTRGDGEAEWTELEARAALDIGHDLGGALLNARLRERDRRLVDQLRTVDSYKSKLISTIAHEFKNPLAAISGHLELMHDDPADAWLRAGSLAAIGRATDRLVAQVGQLLSLQRVSDPDTAREVETVDLNACMRDAVDVLSVQATGVELAVQYAAGPALVRGVRTELEVVCSNLLSNALKYTPAGGSITVSVDVGPNEVLLTVRDTGLGISLEDQSRLFEEFFRSTNPEAVQEPGTGLGLAIVARVVDRHDGVITVDSRPGAGSTFTVRLPTG